MVLGRIESSTLALFLLKVQLEVELEMELELAPVALVEREGLCSTVPLLWAQNEAVFSPLESSICSFNGERVIVAAEFTHWPPPCVLCTTTSITKRTMTRDSPKFALGMTINWPRATWKAVNWKKIKQE